MNVFWEGAGILVLYIQDKDDEAGSLKNWKKNENTGDERRERDYIYLYIYTYMYRFSYL